MFLTQETAAAEDEGQSQAMLFAMLQEQLDKQIAVMTATNKANMDAHDGEDERTGDRWSRKTPNPTRQGKYPHSTE